MVTTKQIFIGITITSITIFICSQFIKFEISSDKKENETDDSKENDERYKKPQKDKRKKIEKNGKNFNKNEDSRITDRKDFLNKLEKLFSGRNFKIVEKIITQMIEESDHEKYLEWLSSQENNVCIKTLNKGSKKQNLSNNIHICVVAKKDIAPGETIYSEKPVVSILNPYLVKEEYCPTCFKKVFIPDNFEEKKENYCSKECEMKAKEDKQLFNNIFTSDETSEKSYVSSMSSCYGISSYDIESEIIYYDNPEMETVHSDPEFKSNERKNKDKKEFISKNNYINNDKDNSNIMFDDTDDSNSNNDNNNNNNNNSHDYNNPYEESQEVSKVLNSNLINRNNVEIIKVNDSFNDKVNDMEEDNGDYRKNKKPNDKVDINRESFLQFFDSKTKSTTTSGVNEKIISYYKQLCWEKEYFYPLLILKLIILIIQDELCFKKKIELLNITPAPHSSPNQQSSPHSQKLLRNRNSKAINHKINKSQPPPNHRYTNPSPHPHLKKPIIYTLWDHIDTFPYIDNYSKYSSALNVDIHNQFSKHDLKFFNLIHTLFFDAFYEFEDFFTDDMYQVLKQKVLYNTFGITSNENIKIDKVMNDIYRIDNNKTIIGLGIYFISSYLRHNCHPNAKISFQNNNNTLSLISTQSIKKGEEITISFIDTHNKSRSQCHEELFSKFKFKCFCDN